MLKPWICHRTTLSPLAGLKQFDCQEPLRRCRCVTKSSFINKSMDLPMFKTIKYTVFLKRIPSTKSKNDMTGWQDMSIFPFLSPCDVEIKTWHHPQRYMDLFFGFVLIFPTKTAILHDTPFLDKPNFTIILSIIHWIPMFDVTSCYITIEWLVKCLNFPTKFCGFIIIVPIKTALDTSIPPLAIEHSYGESISIGTEYTFTGHLYHSKPFHYPRVNHAKSPSTTIKSPSNTIKFPSNTMKSPLNTMKSPLNTMKSPLNPMKPTNPHHFDPGVPIWSHPLKLSAHWRHQALSLLRSPKAPLPRTSEPGHGGLTLEMDGLQ